MKMDQKIVAVSKNVLKIITSLALVFIMCASVFLFSSSADRQQAWDEGIFDSIGEPEFETKEASFVHEYCGFVSSEDSEAGMHSCTRELSCTTVEKFGGKRKRSESDVDRAKRAPTPDRPTATDLLFLSDLQVDPASLRLFLLADAQVDRVSLLSLPLPCPDLSPVPLSLQSALCYVNRPLEGLPGIDDSGQYAQCASDDHVAAGAVGVEKWASEGVSVVSRKEKQRDTGDVGEQLGVKRAHSGEKPFKCVYEGCAYAGTSSSDLVKHTRIHTGEKPYKCGHQGCAYVAAVSNNVTRHMRTHTGEKPYKCRHEGCAYAAIQADRLAIHIRVRHTSEKPYKCDHEMCDYATVNKRSLIEHARTHNISRKFICKQCNYVTLQAIDFDVHSRGCK